MLSIFIFLAAGIAAVQSSPGYFVLSPNVFHVGVEEQVSITVHGVNQPVTVQLYLQDFPHRRKTFSNVQGVFNQDTPGFLKVKVNPGDLPDQDSDISQYVYLVAKSDDAHLRFQKETKVLLSYQDGLVLIQTDKPIYTPKQFVKMRIIPLGFDLKPSKNKVTIVIKNPQGIQVDRWPDLSSDTGFISKVLELGDFVLLGNWTIEAWFGHQLSHNTSAQFEVREYVLPTYSVKITAPDYVVQSARSIPISISARYTYGKLVKGTVAVRLKILQIKQDPILFSTFRTILRDGQQQFSIKTQVIKDLPGNLWFPEGGRLQIEADVIETATGNTESAVDNSVHFTSTPYRIKYKNTAKNFKPGLPFIVRVEVTYPNKKLAVKVPMKISAAVTKNDGTKAELNIVANKDKGSSGNKDETSITGEAEFVIDVPRNTKTLDIKVQTDKDDIPRDQNAEAQYQAISYQSPTNSFLLVRCKRAQVGRFLACEVFLNKGQVNRLSYMVVARGQIVSQDTIVRELGIITTIRFQVTATMSPSARLIVYYVLNTGEVVADSTLMDVDDKFPNDVKILNGQNNFFQEFPSVPITIRVQATAGSRIGFLGVDQSVYLLRNDNRLGSKEVFQTIETLDLGCGVGGGKNNREVFMDAGVSVISKPLVSSERRDLGCDGGARRPKRSVSSVAGDNLPDCCAKGREPSDLAHNCLVRTNSLDPKTFDNACKVRFFNCCVETHGTKDVFALARSGFDDNFDGGVSDEALIDQTQIRSYFPETWLFEEKVTGSNGLIELPVTIPDTITTWIVQALGVSNTTGFGLASPFNLRAFKAFFLDVKLPYSVQRGEQFSVLVTIFNYGEFDLRVNVYVRGNEGFCSVSRPNENSKMITIVVTKGNSKSVSFPIVPIKVGTMPISVIAVSALMGGDGMTKQLLVKPEGVERRRTQSFVLDPRGVLRDAKQDKEAVAKKPDPTPFKSGRVFGSNKQTDNIQLDVPKEAIPESVGAMVYLTGNLLGPVVTDLIGGGQLESRLRMPTGCGEQTMLSLGPNVYVLQYLTNTRQVTAQIEANAYKFIRSGYQRELNYRRGDKSFSAFGESRPGSTWLTAFVMRVFCAAQKFAGVQVDPKVVCESVGWLTANQRADGAFPEKSWVIHKEMTGGLQGDVGMTAFVLTSLLECQCPTMNTNSAAMKAANYLESHLDNINNPYIVAITAYALSLASSPRRFDANQKLSRMAIYDQAKKTRHWNAGARALNIETAGYALLTQMAIGRQRYAGPIVSWLTEQRNTKGGFHSTQDTCVALQALAKYSENTVGRQLNLKVTLTAERDPKWKRIYHITRQNALLQRHEDVSSILGGELFVDTEGSGVAQMQVEVRHNVPTTRDELCRFTLQVRVGEERNGKVVSPLGDQAPPKKVDCKKKYKCKLAKDKKRCRKLKKKCRKEQKKNPKPQKHKPIDALELRVCVRFKGPGKTGMSILDVGIFTGFTVDNKEMKKLENTSFIDRIEPSDRSVVFYLSEIPSNRDTCVTFRVLRLFDVGTIQPVPVNVYDYYEPAEACTTFYGPNPRSTLKMGICEGSQCKCTQDKCTPCDLPIGNERRLVRRACSSHEFAFKGKVVLIDEHNSWLNFNIRVEKIQKQGNRMLKKGKLVEFKKRAGCNCPNLKHNHDYLIMGRDKGGQYILDDSAFVKMWSGKDKDTLERFHTSMTSGAGCG